MNPNEINEVFKDCLKDSLKHRIAGDDCYDRKNYKEALKEYAFSLNSFVTGASFINKSEKYYEAEEEVHYLFPVAEILRRVVRCYIHTGKGEEATGDYKKLYFFLNQLIYIHEILSQRVRYLNSKEIEACQTIYRDIEIYLSGNLGQSSAQILENISNLSATPSGMQEIEGDDLNFRGLKNSFDEFCSLELAFSLYLKVTKKRPINIQKSSSCFIATAAYSTPTHPDLDTFRNFRDEKLLTHPAGQRLVSLYYQISPRIAQYVERQPAIKSWLREQLGRLAQWMRRRGITNH
jgi:hypothetical protein